MATIRSPGMYGAGVGPWEGLFAVAGAVDHNDAPDEQFRAALIFLASGIKKLSKKQMAEGLRFAAAEIETDAFCSGFRK